MSDGKQIWVVLEAEDNKISRHSVALIKEGDRLARAVSGQLHALYVGLPVENLVDTASRHGVGWLHVCTHENLGRYHPHAYEQTILALLGERCPFLMLALASSIGSDVMPRLSFKLGVPLVTNCLDIEPQPADDLVFLRSIQKGRLNARVRCKGESGRMATIIPESLTISEKAGAGKTTPELSEVAMAPDEGAWPMVPIGYQKADHRTIDITEAETIVALGRGVGTKENYQVIVQFADRVGGAVAGTRPTVDMGMLPHERQIGQTGKRVSPKLLFLFGISGAVEFTKGIEGVGTTVAINKDRQAPVFKIAELGIVGDLTELTPRILEHLKP